MVVRQEAQEALEALELYLPFPASNRDNCALANTNSRRTYTLDVLAGKKEGGRGPLLLHWGHSHVHGKATEVNVMPPFIGRGVPRSTEGYCGWIGSGSD